LPWSIRAFGVGATNEIGFELSRLGLRRVRVVTDTKVLTAGPGAAGGRRPAMWCAR
jgi:hypothetical protein